MEIRTFPFPRTFTPGQTIFLTPTISADVFLDISPGTNSLGKFTPESPPPRTSHPDIFQENIFAEMAS